MCSARSLSGNDIQRLEYSHRESNCSSVKSINVSRTQVHRLKLQTLRFQDMTGPEGVGVRIRNGMWMEEARIGTVEDRLQTRRIRQTKDSPVRILAWRAHNGDALRQHHLIAAVRVQISRTHETCLRGVCMDPTEDHQLLRVAVIEIRGFVHRLAGVRRRYLLRNEKFRYEESVRH